MQYKYNIHLPLSFFITAVLLLLFTYGVGAQSYNFRNYTLEEGLPQSQVLCLTQTQDGYIWFGTNGGGITRFDGLDFKVFSFRHGLPSNVVLNLFEDAAGYLWISTPSGISVYDGKQFLEIAVDNDLHDRVVYAFHQDKKGKIWAGTSDGINIIRPTYGPNALTLTIDTFAVQHRLAGRHITDITSSANDEIWVVARKGGLSRLRKTSDSYRVKNYYVGENLPVGNLNKLIIDSRGVLWIGTHNEGMIRGENETFTHFSVKEGLPDKSIYSMIMYEDRQELWVGTSLGIFVIDIMQTPNSKGIHVKQHFSTKNGVVNNHIHGIIKDRENNMWFGTNAGLSRYLGKRFVRYEKTDGLGSDQVFDIFLDSRGAYWFGTSNGATRYVNNTFKTFTPDQGLSASKVQVISEDSKGNLWFGTDSGISRFDGSRFDNTLNVRGLNTRNVWAIHEDREGGLWFASFGSGVDYYHPETGELKNFQEEDGLCNNMVQCIWESPEGNLWFGTNEGCITTYDGDSFQTLDLEDARPPGRILSFTEGRNGEVWIGTYSGVIRYDGNKFETLTEHDGLSSNTVYLVTYDHGNDFLWIGTNNGINRLDVNLMRKTGEVKIKHYSKEEGFTGLECNPDAVLTEAQSIWFGTVKGAMKLNLQEDRTNVVEAVTNITRTRLFFKDTLLPDGSTLPYWQNHLTFDFVGICFTNPHNVQYQYLLEGFDKAWSPVTSENTANYTNLPPGTYTLNVRSRNNEGIWNTTPATFTFTISPPFWQMTEFYGLCLMLLCLGMYGLHKIRVWSIEMERGRLASEVASQTRELQEKNRELEKLSLVASETDNAIVIARPDGYVEWFNEAYIRINGFTLEEFRKEKGNTLQEASTNPDIEAVIEESIRENKSVQYETINITKDGARKWVSSTLTPIFNEENKINKLIIIDTEITKRKQAEELIKQKNKDIISSIAYARRIQQAILPSKQAIYKSFPESFILFRPRDIVSGDFYWFHRSGGKVLLAAVDCTGHGVPGAFMSMIGNELLNQIVIKGGTMDPALVLNELNRGVTNALKQSKERNSQMETKDGMDIALICIDQRADKLVFAGAMRPLMYVRDKQLHEIAGDKHSIGGYSAGKKRFSNKTVKLQQNDIFYLFSDGYPDQFGGPRGKKYMIKRFKKLLFKAASHSTRKQKKLLKEELHKWQQNEEQVDDILVIGVRWTES